MNKKILVTGATGFMGHLLVQELISQGNSVRILVRDKASAEQLFGDTCEIRVGDITKPETLSKICKNIDVVFHLAALMGHDSPSVQAFTRFRLVNVQGTKNMVYQCKLEKIKRFIYISSTAAMGLAKQPIINEQSECNPFTPYQVSKYESEQYLLQEWQKNSFPVIILRPSMVYGPGFKGDFLTLAKLCKTGFFPTIGKGKNLSPALFISDLIKGLLLFIEKGKVGEIYLLSSEESYSLHEKASIIANCLNKKIIFIYTPKFIMILCSTVLEILFSCAKKHPPVTRRNINSIVTDRIIDIKKAKRLGFNPVVSLKEGLTKTIHYFLEQHYL